MKEKLRKIGEVFTPEMLKKAMKIGPNKEALMRKVILPNIKEIEKRCGEEMNTTYLAYMLEYAITKSSSVY